MAKFQLSLVPCSASPVIRDMHRQHREIEASNLREAKQITAQAFPDGFDKSGEWMVELLRPLAVDQKTVAERKWQAGLKPAVAQLPCDHGLFGDDHLQLDLVEMLQTYGE